MSEHHTLTHARQPLDSTPQHTPAHASTADEPYGDSVARAAEWSSLSQDEIRRLIGDGTIKAVRHGRRVIVLRSSLREYLAGLPSYR